MITVILGIIILHFFIDTYTHPNPLVLAAQKNDTERLKDLVTPLNVNDPLDEYGNTLLHIAAECGYKELALFLLGKNAKIWRTNSESTLFITRQIPTGEPFIIKEIEGPMNRKNTPLEVAAYYGYLNLVNIFLQYQTDTKKLPSLNYALNYAICAGHEDIVLNLIHSKKVNLNNNCWGPDYTPLNLAILGGNPQIVIMLLTNGANTAGDPTTYFPDFAHDFLAPIHLAVWKGNAEIIKILVASGADINTLDGRGHTALHWATFYNHPEIAKILLELQANPNLGPNKKIPKKPIAADDEDYILSTHTPLHIAAQKGLTDLAKILIQYKANPNIQGPDDGNTPLHIAAHRGDRILVDLLLENYANPRIFNAQDYTPDNPLLCHDEEILIRIKLNKILRQSTLREQSSSAISTISRPSLPPTPSSTIISQSLEKKPSNIQSSHPQSSNKKRENICCILS